MKNKIRIFFFGLSIFLGFSLLSGCNDESSDVSQPEIAVTNSYLQCVVKDLCPDEVGILCLTPPGMCPGHFDISPAQVTQLRNCRLLLFFDFQKKIEESLSRLKENGLKTHVVTTQPGLCVPETYLTACQEICTILSAEFPEKENQYKQQIEHIEKRLQKLSRELHDNIKQAGIQSAKILASNHQADFANWLGLQTIATFAGSDIETFSNIDQCIKRAKEQNIQFIIANKQEGTSLADALADNLQTKAVIFSNFPVMESEETGFDQLLRSNVAVLLEAAKQ